EAKETIADFSAVIKLDSKAALTLNNRGYNRQLLGDYNDAIEDYQVEMSPARVTWGHCMSVRGMPAFNEEVSTRTIRANLL
ncbi:MAG: tetratricopeptide repeat protein, partial [Planctomycetota bacterium]